jgi:hypothetical protein
MDITAPERYNNLESASGYTLFKPGDNLPESARGVISPQTVNVGFDSLLRKVLPGLPMDPHYIREHGITDAITNMTNGMSGDMKIDLGNLERGRPIMYNEALMGLEQPQGMGRSEILDHMLKHSSHGKSFSPEALKSKVKGLISSKSNESAQKTDKISMLSENFLKTIGENKKNIKTAFKMPSTKAILGNGAMGTLGYMNYNEFKSDLQNGNYGSALGNVGNLAGTLTSTPLVAKGLNSNIANSVLGKGSLGRLNAFAAPFTAIETGKELGELGQAYSNKSIGGMALHGGLAGLDGAMTVNNVRQGADALRSAYGMISKNAPGILRGAGNVATELGGSIASSAPGMLNSAKNLATGANNAFSTGMGRILPQMARAGSVMAPSMSGVANAAAPMAQAANEGLTNLGGKASPSVAKFIPAAAKGIGAVGARSIPFVGDVLQGISAGREGHSIGRGIAAGLGSAAGRIGGGTVGSVVPVAGTIAGEIAGSYAGAAGGSALYDKMFGSNNPAPAAPQPGQPVQANSNPVNPPGSKVEHFDRGAGGYSQAEGNIAGGALSKTTRPDGGYTEGVDNVDKAMDNLPKYHNDMQSSANQAQGANNAQAPLPEQKSGIPPIGQSNSAPVSGAGNQSVESSPQYANANIIKSSEDPVVEPPSIPSVKPMEHIPRPPESPDLVQSPQFASDSVKNENIEHNRAILENRTIQRKASGLPPNPFLGRVTGVQQTTGGVTTQYKPSSNAIVTDQQEALQRAVPAHQSVTDGIDLLSGNGSNGSGYQTKDNGNGSSQLMGPDGKVHGTMQVNPSKAEPNLGLGKSGGLKRRNTGIGDWVNPEDFQYLEKSALWKGITPEEYSNLPLSPTTEGIIQFFLPHS